MKKLFCALNAKTMACEIKQAHHRICYASPGIQIVVAEAIAEAVKRLPATGIAVSLDFDERVMRMGYGDIEAVQILRKAGVQVRNSPGLRAAVLIVDDRGFIFSPTALYLETEPQSEETPNAIRLHPDQIEEVLLRLSPAFNVEAQTKAQTQEEQERLAGIPLEVGIQTINDQRFAEVQEALKQAPPVKFDIARQVRVFEPYLQYVELSLSGASIQRHRVAIPKSIQKLGSDKDLQGRLRTTFDLIEKGSKLSSKELEDELNDIRKNFTPSLGKDHGRVVLKSAKAHLLGRLSGFRSKLEAHQKEVAKKLQSLIDQSRQQVVEYYLPLAQKTPPDALLGQLLRAKPTRDDVRKWLEDELGSAFPQAEKLVGQMSLEERYKDITYETLNRPDFLKSVKAVFPRIEWDKAYEEFKAAGESDSSKTTNESNTGNRE
jgi:hypothetical protein